MSPAKNCTLSHSFMERCVVGGYPQWVPVFFYRSDDLISCPEGSVLCHFRSTKLKDVSESTRPIWKLVLEKKLDVPTPLLQLYSNGLPVSELPQDGNTGEISGVGASNSTSELVQDKEMEATGGTRGSGNSVELENKNSDHKMEVNLRENHHVKSVQRKYK